MRPNPPQDQPKYVYVTCVFGDSKSRADLIAHALRIMGPDICYTAVRFVVVIVQVCDSSHVLLPC